MIQEGVDQIKDGNVKGGVARIEQGLAVLASNLGPLVGSPSIDVEHIADQIQFSDRVFGPTTRSDAIRKHIKSELKEIKEKPNDLSEWADIIILGIDGAWRSIAYEGGLGPDEDWSLTPNEIAQMIIDEVIRKQKRNEARTWPDWREVPEGQHIEHVCEVHGIRHCTICDNLGAAT